MGWDQVSRRGTGRSIRSATPQASVMRSVSDTLSFFGSTIIHVIRVPVSMSVNTAFFFVAPCLIPNAKGELRNALFLLSIADVGTLAFSNATPSHLPLAKTRCRPHGACSSNHTLIKHSNVSIEHCFFVHTNYRAFSRGEPLVEDASRPAHSNLATCCQPAGRQQLPTRRSRTTPTPFRRIDPALMER